MKIIPLKTKMVDVPGLPPQELSFTELMQAVMTAPAGQGVTMAEIVERMPVVNAIKAAVDEKATSLILEDAQWNTLNRLISNFQHWRLVDQFIVDLGDAVKNAETYTPPKPEPVVVEAPAEAAN